MNKFGCILLLIFVYSCMDSFEELDIARTPSQAAKSRQSGKAAKPKADPVHVTFGINDVDRANLIAELDFKGKHE